MSHKPRIGLVVDTVGWAFWNIAQQLRRHLGDAYDFEIVPARQIDDDITRILLLTGDCDLVHFFWREHFFLIGTPYARSCVATLEVPYAEFERRYIRGRRFSASVYDHLYLEPEEAAERRVIFAERVSGYYVSSDKLRREYERLPGYPPPVAVLPDGVDTTLFRPQACDRFERGVDRPLVVGWAGNSRWAREREDFKGVESLLRPAIAELQAEGVNVVAHFADSAERMIPHRAMPDYYAQIDVYVCPSKCEGTPNPVLEAMACGVPVISTDVGIVAEVLGRNQQAFLVDRKVEAFKDALRRLAAAPAIMTELSKENLQRIAVWDWSLKAQPFRTYFDRLLATRPGGL